MQRAVLSPAGALPFVRAAVRLTRALDRGLRRTPHGDGLTFLDLSVLGGIKRSLTLPSTLARELQLDPPRITRVTDRLVSLDYVRREADPADRRLCRLELTPAGVDRYELGLADLAAIMDDLLAGLTETERAGLELGFGGVMRVLDAQSKD